jgi:hypothetical protein
VACREQANQRKRHQGQKKRQSAHNILLFKVTRSFSIEPVFKRTRATLPESTGFLPAQLKRGHFPRGRTGQEMLSSELAKRCSDQEQAIKLARPLN